MKKFLFVLGCAVMAFAAASCSKEILSENSPEGTVVKSTVGVEAEAVKTSLGGEQGLSIVWSEGDAIGLFSSNGTLANVKATLTKGAGSSSGTFEYEAEGTAAGEDIYAYYPYADGVTISGTALQNVVLPCAQTYRSAAEAISGCILAGKLTGGTIHLKNTCAIVKVSLTGNDDLSQLSIMGRDESMTGTGTVEIGDGSYPIFMMGANPPSTGKSTGAAFATGYTGSSKTSGAPLATLSATPFDLYFVVPSSVEFGDGCLYLEAVTPKYSMAVKSVKSHMFERNHIQPFNLTVAKHEYSNLVNLSVNGKGEAAYSNCYIVRPSASDANYSIGARAADGSLRYGNADEAADAPGAAARLVWETSEGLVTDVNMDWEKKAINFTVPGGRRQGSAIICIVNQYNNSIYWTWHIWISDTVDQRWGDSPVFQDRNLGAEWTPKTFNEVEGLTAQQALTTSGLLYQYGNSYPFPRANTMTPHTTDGAARNQEKVAFGELTQNVVIYKFNKWTQGFFSVGRALTSSTFKMDDFRWYPMALNYNNANDTDPAFGCAWASNVDPYGEGASYSWGRGLNKARRDPCPLGYKVPSDAEFVWFRRPQTGTKSDGNAFYWQYLLDRGLSGCTGNGTYVNLGQMSYGAYQTTDWVRDANNRGAGEVVWIPKQGVRLGKGFSNAGAMERNGYYYPAGSSSPTTGACIYWCISPSASTNVEGVSTVISSKGSTTSTGESWIQANGNLYCYGYLATSSACSVRCVKISGAADSGVDAGGLEDGGTDPNPWN